MIRRIQQFTTQEIPVQQIAGLEPKTGEPRIFMGPRPGSSEGRPSFGRKNFSRPDARPGQRTGGKPFGGQGFGRDNGPSHFNREGGPAQSIARPCTSTATLAHTARTARAVMTVAPRSCGPSDPRWP